MFGANLSDNSAYVTGSGGMFGANGSFALSEDYPKKTPVWGPSTPQTKMQLIQGQRDSHEQVNQIDRQITTQERTPGVYR
jgi:hypothetical protein